MMEDGQDDSQRWQYFSDSTGRDVFLSVHHAEERTFSIDTENKESIKQIQINGFDGVVIQDNNTCNIVYADTAHNTFVQVYCVGLSEEFALSLISDISFVEE